jgi:hypothetical protein
MDCALSDVEQDLWAKRGQLGPVGAGRSITEIKGKFGQGFGIAVSDTLYTKLQQAQGLTVNSLLAKDQPTVSSEDYTSYNTVSGGCFDANCLLGNAIGAGSPMVVCRRTNTSGTQAFSDTIFLEFPCQGGALTLNPVGGSIGAGDTLIVREESSTGNVLGCLNNGDPAAGQEYAMGLISLENAQPAALGGSWKYVKLDGQSPNFHLVPGGGLLGTAAVGDPDATQRQNVVDAQYIYAAEGVCLFNSLGPNQAACSKLCDSLGANPPAPGIFSVPTATLTHTGALPASLNKVHRGTRFGNTCQLYQTFDAVR